MTSLTVECMSTYEDCLNKTCDVVDANIKVIMINYDNIIWLNCYVVDVSVDGKMWGIESSNETDK